MGASFSPTVTSYSQRLLNSNSFNNSTASEIELPSADDPTPPTSGIAHAPTAATSPGSAAEDIKPQDDPKIHLSLRMLFINGPPMTGGDPRVSTGSAAEDIKPQDDPKPILIAIAAAILAGSFALLANPPKPVQNVVLYNIYSLFLLLSFVLSIVSLLFILSTTSNQLGGTGTGTAWVRMKALQIAGVSLGASVILRIFLQLSAHIKWYEVLVPVLVLGGISICLLIGWIKTNDSAQIPS